MNKTLASGQAWVIWQEGDTLYLALKSEYGTVEVKAKRFDVLTMLEKVVREYDKLKAEGLLVPDEGRV